MKIKFNRQSLLTAVITAMSATPARTPKDILRNVLLTGAGMHFDVVGTDQEIGIIAAIPESAVLSNESKVRVSILIPPQRIRSILQELKDAEVTLDVSDSDVRVIASSAKFRIATEDSREFPPVPSFVGSDCFRVAGPVLSSAIRRTEFACDTESTRYALGGINVEVKDQKLILAATDSRRLSVVEMACEIVGSPKPIEKATVVPSKAWRALQSALSAGAETASMQVSANDVTFQAGNVTVYSRLVEGRFPRYRDVIPSKSRCRLSLPCGPFFTAVRQSMICLDKEETAVNLKFENGMLRIESQSSVGQSAVEFPCEYESEDARYRLDPKYLADYLKTMPAEQLVELSLISPDDAVVFRIEDSSTYVVMPLVDDR